MFKPVTLFLPWPVARKKAGVVGHDPLVFLLDHGIDTMSEELMRTRCCGFSSSVAPGPNRGNPSGTHRRELAGDFMPIEFVRAASSFPFEETVAFVMSSTTTGWSSTEPCLPHPRTRAPVNA